MTKEQEMDGETVNQLLHENDIDTIKLGMVDIDGLWRGKRVTVDYFLNSIIPKGAHICDIIFGWDIQDKLIQGLKFTGWHTGYPDVFLVPDISTIAIVPWEERTASVICDVVDANGNPVAISPRYVLRKILNRMKEDELTPMVGYELEFYLLKETLQSLEQKNYTDIEPLTRGPDCYSLYRGTRTEYIIGELRRNMNKYGIIVDAANSEYGSGQFEVNLHYCPAMTAADRSLLFKIGIKEIATIHDIFTTFMAKYNHDDAGSSAHVHQSISDGSGKNLFSDGEGGLSVMAMHYLAGVIATLPEFMALYCPNINSYKRIVEDSWTGINATWARENRTTAVRTVVSSASATRIENRIPGADANPHIVIAACIAGGLYGMNEKLKSSEPTAGNAYELPDEDIPQLPKSLESAIEVLYRSNIARDLLGSEFVDHFVATRSWEIQEYRKVVTDWERHRYLEMI
ncbi:MAG: glutamine synthetase [Gammaproteobacteria bacterium]|nr:glutamine synthetase [Gammaproteobacteria bacterium]